MPARGRDVDRVRVGRRSRGLATTDRLQHRGLPGVGTHRVLLGAVSFPGSITKTGNTHTGNTHTRRLLVEAAWHHLQPYRIPGATMRARWELAPVAARDRGHAGNRRLHQRWLHFTDRKKDL